jgi:hypothetical protein
LLLQVPSWKKIKKEAVDFNYETKEIQWNSNERIWSLVKNSKIPSTFLIQLAGLSDAPATVKSS